MNAITTHILDTSRGEPASGVHLVLDSKSESGAWERVSEATSGLDGRATLLGEGTRRGIYRITFDSGAYFAAHRVAGFYPEIHVVFEVRDGASHHHVPLLLSPYGYSTYRGT